MSSNNLLAILLLALFIGAAVAVLRFAGDLLGAGKARIAAAGTAGVGVVVFVLMLFGGGETETKPLFETLVARNQGAVSYVFFVEQAGEPQELRVWPMRAAGAGFPDLLAMRIVLSAPGRKELFNEVVRVPTVNLEGVKLDNGTTGRAQEWAAWTRNFTPAETGMYELALGLPAGAPEVQVRIARPGS